MPKIEYQDFPIAGSNYTALLQFNYDTDKVVFRKIAFPASPENMAPYSTTLIAVWRIKTTKP